MSEQDTVEQGIEARPFPAITEEGKYVILRVAKMWGDFRYRVGTDDTSVGITYEPPHGSELLVGFVIQGKEDVKEELPEGVMSESAFNNLLERQLKMKLRLRKLQQDTF